MLNNKTQKRGKFSLAGLLIMLFIAVIGLSNVSCSNTSASSVPIAEPTLPATAQISAEPTLPTATQISAEPTLPAATQISAEPTLPAATQISAEPTLPAATQISAEPTPESVTSPDILLSNGPRGYLTTPQELQEIARKAAEGIEPYVTAVGWVLEEADKPWAYSYKVKEVCPDAHSPAWNDNGEGTAILYAKALAYHLTAEERYAEEVKNILQEIITEVETISLFDEQCQLNFAWGTPELVSSADLIENYWRDTTCTGPLSTEYEDTTSGKDQCKRLFQNWLVKNPYTVVSLTAESSTSNWGAAATNATAHIADYLGDRPQVKLLHRNPVQINNGQNFIFTPAEAYAHANSVALARMNGYRVQYGNNRACDLLDDSPEQSKAWPFVKSQISERGILPDDARRTEYCNILTYNNEEKHNYPQLHLGNNIQQCELMLRRGNSSCYDNRDDSDLPQYKYVDTHGVIRTTHLYPGRGSIERGINAIVDAGISWQHDPALEVAYRYYSRTNSSVDYSSWFEQLNRRRTRCLNHLCFGVLTHGFAEGENPAPPPTVPPPGAVVLED